MTKTKNTLSNYSQSFLAAVLFHLILLALFLFHLRFSENTPLPSSASEEIIQATLISTPSAASAPTTTQEAKPIQNPEKPISKPIEKPIIEATSPPEKTNDIASEKAINITETQKDAEKKLALEKIEKEKVAEKKATLEKKRQIELQKQIEAETQPKEETQQKQQQKTIEQLLQQDLANSKPTKSNAKATSSKNKITESNSGIDNKEIDHYKSLIISAISHRWIVPENLAKGLSCHLSVRVAPGGVVMNVKLIKSSGNAALDHSAEAAIYKASPLPTPKESGLFNEFREFNLVVRPEGILTE